MHNVDAANVVNLGLHVQRLISTGNVSFIVTTHYRRSHGYDYLLNMNECSLIAWKQRSYKMITIHVM